MWIFMNDSMLSIVASRDDSDQLLVRARNKGDIERVFPNADVFEDPLADYLHRAFIPRDKVMQAIAERLVDIDYDNFKSSIPPGDAKRHDAYLGVWSVMYGVQESTFQLDINDLAYNY